jgi:hypothetical protein
MLKIKAAGDAIDVQSPLQKTGFGSFFAHQGSHIYLAQLDATSRNEILP